MWKCYGWPCYKVICSSLYQELKSKYCPRVIAQQVIGLLTQGGGLNDRKTACIPPVYQHISCLFWRRELSYFVVLKKKKLKFILLIITYLASLCSHLQCFSFFPSFFYIMSYLHSSLRIRVMLPFHFLFLLLLPGTHHSFTLSMKLYWIEHLLHTRCYAKLWRLFWLKIQDAYKMFCK